MFEPVTLIVDAFAQQLGRNYRAVYGKAAPDHAPVIRATAKLALERIAGSDALYHDLSHTLFVTDVGQAILTGRAMAKAVAPKDWLHFTAATLLRGKQPEMLDKYWHAFETRERTVDTDEGPRGDASMESLGKLRPVFHARGSVTAGNSSQMSDGAAAVMLVSERMLKEHNLTPLARFAGFAVGGVAPEIMGIGPIAAIPKVLAQVGIKQDDLDWIELNEAFAAQALAVLRQLGLSDDVENVNPNGGAIALGHPLGASGGRLMITALNQLEATGGKRALATMCIGVGQGIAMVIERV